MCKARYSGVRSLFRHHRMLLITITALSCYSALLPALSISEPEKSWEQLQRDGTTALDTNRYWIAEPLLKRAIIQARTLGYADLRLAKSLDELGRLYAVRGRFAEAESYLEQGLLVKEEALGKQSGQIIPAMGSLIRFYLVNGTASKADPLAEEVLAFLEGKLREPLQQTEAKVKFQKGVPLQAWAGTAAPVARDPVIEWAITCDDIGNLYRIHGNFDLADRLFKAALDLKTTVLGKEHLSLANSFDSLGEVCLARNDLPEAVSFFQDALSYTERILPPESPAVYARLDKLAKCLIKAGKYKQAEDLYLRAQNFWKEDQTACNNEARALLALGCLYLEEKKYAEAAPVLEKAADLAEQINGPFSVDLVQYLQRYAYTLYYLGRKPEMEQLKAQTNTILGDTL